MVLPALTAACATGNNIVRTLSAPNGTPAGKPNGGYDRVMFSCGTIVHPEPVFIGRVVRRGADGELSPMLGVSVLIETHGTIHATPTPNPIPIVQDKDGRFQYRFILHSTTITYFKEDVAVGWEEIEDTATFTFNGKGCEPLQIIFTDPGQEKTVEMYCAAND